MPGIPMNPATGQPVTVRTTLDISTIGGRGYTYAPSALEMYVCEDALTELYSQGPFSCMG